MNILVATDESKYGEWGPHTEVPRVYFHLEPPLRG